jgi:hypothetical protein
MPIPIRFLVRCGFGFLGFAHNVCESRIQKAFVGMRPAQRSVHTVLEMESIVSQVGEL